VKRRQQPNNPEDSSNGVSGGVPASEAGVEAEIKGFKRPAKRVNKERSVTGDGVSEEEETEVIDDWGDDIKSQDREKQKSKDRKEKFVSKRSKDKEERLGSVPVVTGAKLTAEREMQKVSNLVKEAFWPHAALPVSASGHHRGEDSVDEEVQHDFPVLPAEKADSVVLLVHLVLHHPSPDDVRARSDAASVGGVLHSGADVAAERDPFAKVVPFPGVVLAV
jgi:hypothetical protein